MTDKSGKRTVATRNLPLVALPASRRNRRRPPHVRRLPLLPSPTPKMQQQHVAAHVCNRLLSIVDHILRLRCPSSTLANRAMFLEGYSTAPTFSVSAQVHVLHAPLVRCVRKSRGDWPRPGNAPLLIGFLEVGLGWLVSSCDHLMPSQYAAGKARLALREGRVFSLGFRLRSPVRAPSAQRSKKFSCPFARRCAHRHPSVGALREGSATFCQVSGRISGSSAVGTEIKKFLRLLHSRLARCARSLVRAASSQRSLGAIQQIKSQDPPGGGDPLRRAVAVPERPHKPSSQLGAKCSCD